MTNTITKWTVARQDANIFDPNVYLSPITIQVNLFMQNRWRIGDQCDDPLAFRRIQDWPMDRHCSRCDRSNTHVLGCFSQGIWSCTLCTPRISQQRSSCYFTHIKKQCSRSTNSLKTAISTMRREIIRLTNGLCSKIFGINQSAGILLDWLRDGPLLILENLEIINDESRVKEGRAILLVTRGSWENKPICLLKKFSTS